MIFGLVRSWGDYNITIGSRLAAVITLPGAFSDWQWRNGSQPYEIDDLTFTVFVTFGPVPPRAKKKSDAC